MPKTRKKNGRYATQRQYQEEAVRNLKRKLSPLAVVMGSAFFSYGVTLSPAIHTNYFTTGEVQVQAESASSTPMASPAPTVGPVEVAKPEITASAEPEVVKPEVPAGKEEIAQYIMEVFGDEGNNAVKIAMCESGLNPNNVGDTHLMGTLNGELIGDSVGIFQIRTGDAGIYDSTPWNRARANGMTAEEFRAALKDYRYNTDYAKEIYDRQGWFAWNNCRIKVL